MKPQKIARNAKESGMSFDQTYCFLFLRALRSFTINSHQTKETK